MLFLDFLRLFFCIVFLNAHPISKSNSYIPEFVEKFENDNFIQTTDNIITNSLHEETGTHVKIDAIEKKYKIDKSGLRKINKQGPILKRKPTTKEIDLRAFKRLEKICNINKFHNSIKTYTVKDEENNIFKENDLNQNTESYKKTIFSTPETESRFYNDTSMESTTDETDFAITTQIETILNEIKQREIQIIADQLPLLSNLINNAVAEITFASLPLISASNGKPNLTERNNHYNAKLHHLVRRSIKHDSSTLANDVENLLQSKIKKVYHKIKTKFSKDLKNEIKRTKATAKKQFDKITKKICNTTQNHVHKASKNFVTIQAKAKIAKTQSKSTPSEIRKSRKTLFDQKKFKHNSIPFTTHTIPSITDDATMLSILEQILDKSQNNELMVSTPNYLRREYKGQKIKRDSHHETLKNNIQKVVNNKENQLYTEYINSNNSLGENADFPDYHKNNNLETDGSNEDSSYKALSNKISYNDYVNGYKYYLNFQRDGDNQKYSNQIRYQAHKHHNVDDIGKFILNKIPQLCTTRLKRNLVDYETLEDQDVSTKSEDSWFKKHFFMFIDSNPPKKFHTSQTITLKPSEKQNISNCTYNATVKHTYEENELSLPIKHRIRKHVKNIEKTFKEKVLQGEKRQKRLLRNKFKRSTLESHYKQKSAALLNFDHKNNGFVDIDLIHKPTAIIKLKNKNKKENKFRNIFYKIGFSKSKKKEKRQSQNRFNFFKGLKNMFKEKNDLKATRHHKIFDYEIMTDENSEQPYEDSKFTEIFKINELSHQNPTGKVDHTPTALSENYFNLNDFILANLGHNDGKSMSSNRKTELNDERKSYSILRESPSFRDNEHSVLSPYFSKTNQKDPKMYDTFVEHLKTKTQDFSYTPDMNTLYSSTPALTKSNIQNEIDDLRLRLLKFGNNKEIQKLTTQEDIEKEYKNQKIFFLNDHPQSKFLKDNQIELPLIYDKFQSDNINIKNPSTIDYTTERMIFSKKNTENHDILLLYKSNYSQTPSFRLIPVKLEAKKFAVKKLGLQDNLFNDSKVLTYDKSFNTLQDKNYGLKKNKFRPHSNDLTMFVKSVEMYHRLNKLQTDNNLGLKKNKLRPTPNDWTMFAHYDRFNKLQEDKSFDLKKEHFSPSANDLTMIEYNKKDSNPLEDKNFALNNNKFRLSPLDWTMSSNDKSFNNLQENKDFVLKNYKFRPPSKDMTIFKYGNRSNGQTELKPVVHFNDYTDVNIKKPVAKINTPPQQYYSTPLPMKNEDFYKFLKNQNMDVESVTSPLTDTLPKRIDVWNSYKKNVTKLLSNKQNILGNLEPFKTTDKIKEMADKYFHPNVKKMFNITKTEKSKPLLGSRKVLNKDKQKNYNNSNSPYGNKILDSGHNNKIKSRQRFFNYQENSMSYATSESMDLFQLDEMSKTPIVTKSPNKVENLDVTVIERSKYSDLDVENILLNIDTVNEHQLLTKKSKTYSSSGDSYRDHLKFSNVYTKPRSTPKTTNSKLYSFISKKPKPSQTQPHRVQISGHSYKYDIIYEQATNDWRKYLDIYDVYPTYNLSKNTNSGRYKDFPLLTTTIKNKNGNRHRYYRRGNFGQYIDHFTPMVTKTDKKYTFLDPLNSTYPITQSDNLKKNVSGTRKKCKKYFYFGDKKPKDIDDEVYFEPVLERKSNRKTQNKSSTRNNYYKRDAHVQDAFTAKNVAALEVVVDLVKSTDAVYDKGFRNTFLDRNDQKKYPYLLTSSKFENHATNSIQVHIALPSNLDDRKRSLEPIKVRKVFSAIMSTPVDLAYQIDTFEENNVTKVPEEVISPGLYLLVENTNITSPNCNFALKPIRSPIGISKMISSKSVMNITCKNDINSLIYGNVSKATMNPDIRETVNSHLVELNKNIPIRNETKSKRCIKDEITFHKQNGIKVKRGMSWEIFKKYFDHDRVCNCRCKINTTMCKPCAASDAVISELIFEFDNIAKYMTDHCTEIQTFFWMNPSGGRKLKDTFHRLDTTLNNYYKRQKDKCRGRTCQMISSSIDKREYNNSNTKSKFIKDLDLLANELKNVEDKNLYDINVFNSGKKCVHTINNCINTRIKRNFNKRLKAEELGNTNFYSLDKIKVNLICNKDIIKHENNGSTKNIINGISFEGNNKIPLNFYDDKIKREKKKGCRVKSKGIKELLKKYSNKLNFGQNKGDQDLVKEREKFTKIQNKRQPVFENQVEDPFMSDRAGIFLKNYSHYNVRKTRQQKDLLKRNVSIHRHADTEKTITTNTFSSRKAKDKLENANENDDTQLKIDTLNHNLNDLFKLLGDVKFMRMNEDDLKLEISSKRYPNSSSINKNKTLSKLTTAKTIVTFQTHVENSKTQFSENGFKNNQTTIRHLTKNETLKTTKKVITTTFLPKTSHTTIVLTPRGKGRLLNRIVGVSLKFLGKKDNKDLKDAKSSYVGNGPGSEIVNNCKKKFIVNTEIKPFKEIDNNNNIITTEDSTIIIIDDVDFSKRYTVPIKGNNCVSHYSSDTIKETSLKLLKEKNVIDTHENKRNAITLNTLTLNVKNQALTKNKTQNNIKHCDYNIIESIRRALGLTSNNLTIPGQGKGGFNKIFNKISNKFTPNDKRAELQQQEERQNIISSNPVTPKLSLKNTQNLSTYTSEKNIWTFIANTTVSKSDTGKTKMAGEDGLNQICDISGTMAFMIKLQKSLLKEQFGQYVKNVPCHKYKRAPKYFIIRSCIRRPSKITCKRLRKSRVFGNINKNGFQKWDWIRNKRAVVKDESRVEDDTEEGKYIKDNINNTGCKRKPLLSFSNYLYGRRKHKRNSDLNGNFIQLLDGENDYYENFIRGKDGIYGKSLKRRKRLDADMSELNEGLLNLPPLRPSIDEIYAIVAESISFDCHLSGSAKNQYRDYIWTTDRVGILDFKNVIVDGPKVYIMNIQTNNSGNYLCNTNNVIVKSIKLTVIDLPAINIIFTPFYEIEICSYDNLKTLQELSELMSLFTCKYECSARIDEPICLKDRIDGSTLIRPIVVMSVKRQTNINCSAECLRDLHCSIAMLLAKNAPALALVKVLIPYNDTKRILSPLRERKRSFVTHTLRGKDSNGHREYHMLAADMDPNSVNVVLLCSAGFYLVVGQKICAVCPPNTYSLDGENVCRNCPRGAFSEPGSRSCRLSLHLRKYNCSWKYECGIAVCMLSCVIASCYAVLRLLRQPDSAKEIKNSRKTREGLQNGGHEKRQKRRPLSPSRVILSRLLQGSFSSSRATDSQETRFELWKEKNTLPPLPPIDFEL